MFESCVVGCLLAVVATASFERATPESQGIPSRAIQNWVEAADKAGGYQGFVLLRHGKTVAEGYWKPYAAETPHLQYSLSKSFTSTAIGMLVDDGKLDIDERVSEIFPDKLPASPSTRLLSMRVRDLLCMNTGHDAGSLPKLGQTPDGDWIRGFLACPVPYGPGRRFCYDSGATYVLSAIVRERTGQNVSEFLRTRLFDPLGIGPVRWNQSPQGIDCGGWGLVLTTRDIARFGQFWLQQGSWAGRRLLSRHYVAQASSKETENNTLGHFEGEDVDADWHQGYGFQFWMCRHGCYRAAGAYGQLVVIMPEKDAVLAINSNSPMVRSLSDTWSLLLANMRDGALSEDPAAASELEQRVASLSVPLLQGARTGDADIVGKTFRDADCASFDLSEDKSGWILRFDRSKLRCSVPIGCGEWQSGSIVFPEKVEYPPAIIDRQPTFASGAWDSSDVFRARILFAETPHHADVSIRRTADGAELEMTSTAKNVNLKIVGR